ncbi:hypothetical protein ACFL31_00025 [Candidatus Margulisiibacteriota bacterium]
MVSPAAGMLFNLLTVAMGKSKNLGTGPFREGMGEVLSSGKSGVGQAVKMYKKDQVGQYARQKGQAAPVGEEAEAAQEPQESQAAKVPDVTVQDPTGTMGTRVNARVGTHGIERMDPIPF